MKGLKGIILGVLLAASVLMPFNVFAGTVTGDAPIIGVNVYVIDYEYGRIPVQGTVTLTTDMTRWQCVSGTSSRCSVWQSQDTSDTIQDDITGTITYSNGSYSAYLYEFDFVFDDDYVGYVRFSSQITAGSGNIYYVNGSHLTITSTSLINSFTITEYQLTSKADKNIMWQFPLESFNFIYHQFDTNKEILGIDSYNKYYLPLFQLDVNDSFMYLSIPAGYTQDVVVCFFGILPLNINNVKSMFSFPASGGEYMELSDYQVIEPIWTSSSTVDNGRFIKFKVTNNGTSGYNGVMQYIFNRTIKFMPVYFNYDYHDYITTDFALLFGLNNRLLKNLDIIANGTSSSNQSASDLESGNDQMADDMNDLATIENGYNQDFNNQLENIDFTNPIQSNQGILPAANFVISVFNGLISNNPFSLLIIICCILLIGKKVIGK